MTFKLQIILLLVSMCGLVFIFKLIAKGVLQLRYSILWLLVGTTFTILAIFPKILNLISQLLGIITPVNALFLTGYIFLLALIFSLTIAVSRYSDKVKDLVQEIALLKKEIEKINKL